MRRISALIMSIRVERTTVQIERPCYRSTLRSQESWVNKRVITSVHLMISALTIMERQKHSLLLFKLVSHSAV